jgi:hypothetical protein
MNTARRAVACLLGLMVAAGTVIGVQPVAQAAAGDVGFAGHSYAGARNAATADKAQSKLWHHDGRWWATMFEPVSTSFHIYWLDRTKNAWVDTGVAIDDRDSSSADTLWDGKHLYVASHRVRTAAEQSQAGYPANLYRYSYVSSTKTWALDAGYPSAINNVTSESLTIDKDSTGALWATWTQVDASGASVYLNTSGDGGKTWGTPFVVPAGNANARVVADDISALVAFSGKIGVLWSNQADDTVYWAVHQDGAPLTNWTGGPALRGPGSADDHVNVKSLQSDASGRVFAVLKSALDHVTGSKPSDPSVRLMVFKPGTGAWSMSTVGTIGDCNTRPQLVLDESNKQVHVVMTGKAGTGVCNTGLDGAIYLKSAPMDNPVFAAGQGRMIIRDAASEALNDATLTKQSVTAGTGLVVLAGNNSTKRYWHADVPLGTSTPTSPSGGAIDARWTALGGAAGALGEPTSPETATTGKAGSFRDYRGGSIYWSAATGARALTGPVKDRYRQVGAQNSALGFPTTDLVATADRAGRFANFQGGTIIWSSASGARVLVGPVQGKWNAMGRATSVLRYPVTDVVPTADRAGRFANFQGGTILWSSATGARALRGPILAKYNAMGRATSRLGYPTSDVYAVAGGQRANFQRGWITWTSTKGAVVTFR